MKENKVNITVRKDGTVKRFSCPTAQAARMVENMTGMGFEVLAVIDMYYSKALGCYVTIPE